MGKNTVCFLVAVLNAPTSNAQDDKSGRRSRVKARGLPGNRNEAEKGDRKGVYFVKVAQGGRGTSMASSPAEDVQKAPSEPLFCLRAESCK